MEPSEQAFIEQFLVQYMVSCSFTTNDLQKIDVIRGVRAAKQAWSALCLAKITADRITLGGYEIANIFPEITKTWSPNEKV
jgi:hypothetical protein